MITLHKLSKIAAASMAALLLLANICTFADVPAAEHKGAETTLAAVSDRTGGTTEEKAAGTMTEIADEASEGTAGEASEEGAGEEAMRFVLMMDVSRTMNQSDPKGYGKDAARMFADMLPADKARVSVFSFGNDSTGKSYEYSAKLAPVTRENGNYVQMLTGFSDPSSAKNAVKEAVAELSWNGEQTPLDAAVLAGADVLQKDGEGGKACVILVTDGDYKSRFITDPKDPVRDIDRAVEVFAKNGWNVYCIELDYANNEGKRGEANRFLTENITDKTGGKTWQVAKAEDVGKAYMEIIDSFLGAGELKTLAAGEDGFTVFDFEIPELSSETSITVNAEPLSGITLYHGPEAVPFNAEWGDTWCNIDLKLPAPGQWQLKAQAAPGTEVACHVISFAEMIPEICLLPEENSPDAPFSKKDGIETSAALSFHGKNVPKESLGGVTAVLLLTGDNGATKEIPMDFSDEKAAFTGKMTFAEAGRAGKIRAAVELRTSDGRSLPGTSATYYTKNRPVEKKAGASIELTGFVHEPAAEISAATLFADPDGEPVFVKFDFSGPAVSVSGDGKTVSVTPGDVSGVYEGQLLVWDADMGEAGAVKIPASVTVQNHPMQAGRLPDLDMTAEYVKEKDIDVTGLFTDEDQPALTASLKDDYDGEVLDAALSGNTLRLSAKTDGTTKITLYATDDDGKEYTVAFSVKGATDASIRRQKLAILLGKLGAAGIVAAILVVAAILAILLVRANSKIRGEWKITVTVPGADPWKVTVDAGAELPKKDRRSTNLYRLLDLDERSSRNKTVAYLQENEHILKKVKITGAMGVNGGKITVSPPVTLRVNGGRAVTSAKFADGEAELMVEREDAAMNIRITL